ncbi:MAG: HNH endonuclease signature motif containing protein [Anaerolineae bacterium]|nr:HNH endonuclease signature motif containing protein [Anaerolineae bacterium]
MKLTKIQREVLELLENGAVMTIDCYNMPSIGDRNLSPQTRYFLTDKRLVTRKDKTKSVETKGNGFVITDKGRNVLSKNPSPKKRKVSRILKKEKTCPDCKWIKSIDDFVTIYGVKNPRGKYCQECFDKHQREHAISLMEGRDFCLYCGNKIKKAYDWTPEGNSERTYLHLDHMDPVSLGGEDSERNAVYCCVSCNLKKGNKLYSDWLNELKPECRDISREIYIQKHGREPEGFRPSENVIVLAVDLADIYEKL